MLSRLFTIFCIAIICTACDSGPTATRGFSLPEGDAEKGKQVFSRFQCLACHTISGYDQKELGEDINKEMEYSITLGGEVNRAKTYAQLLTAIINPSHRFSPNFSPESVQIDGVSKMKNYNDVMTVSQLIDLVSFLQPHYQLRPYDTTHYMDYR